MSYPTITCPTDCDQAVPEISMDECNPAVDFSEVDKIYLTQIDQPLADWTDASEWTSRIDNDGTDVDDIREIWVSGELPEPERNETEIDNDRTVESPKKFTLTAEVFEANTTNYDAVRFFQCGSRFLMWFSSGAYLYGGTDGIEVNIVADAPITKGSREANPLMLKLIWEAKHSPERIDNPLI